MRLSFTEANRGGSRAVAAIGNSAYTAAEHGVVELTKNAAAEYGPEGLRINRVGPAYIETPLLANLPDELHSVFVVLPR